MAPLFTVEGHGAVEDYPGSFEGCVAFCEAYESTPRPYDERARYIGISIFNLFAYRYLPPGLRWLGFEFPRALSLPTTLRAFRMEPTNPVLAAVIVFVVRMVLLVSEALLPDPKVAFIEALDDLPETAASQRNEDIKKLDKSYEQFVKTQLSGPGCPLNAKLQ